MCGNPSTRLLIRFIIDFIVLLGIFIIALIGLPNLLRSHIPSETLTNEERYSTKVWSNPLMLTLTRRGFFCSDDSLRYPFKPDTLLNKVHMTILTIALPAAVILIVEMLRTGFNQSDHASLEAQKFNFIGIRIPLLISECYQLMGSYLFGLGLLLITVALLKHWTGRLRPYFFDVCQPQFPDNTNCDDDENFGIYIENYSCSELATVSADLLASLRQSFPSGYVTCAAYALGFLIFYLQARMRNNWQRLLRIVLQMIAAAMLALVAIERISSMRNHWTDVCAGIVLGLLFAFFIDFVVLQLFQHIAERRTTTNTIYGVRRQKY